MIHVLLYRLQQVYPGSYFHHHTNPLSGDPPTTYINASEVHFKGVKQTYIATQAPRQDSFENFWRLVLEKGVKVIVMLTALEESKKKKADQYWPDEQNKTKVISQDIILGRISQSTFTSFYSNSQLS